MLKQLLLLLLIPVVHELGHQVMAWLLGVKISWKFKGWRLVWDYKFMYPVWRISLTKVAGFGFEFAYAILLAYKFHMLLVPIVCLLHFFLYPFYAKGIHADFEAL